MSDILNAPFFRTVFNIFSASKEIVIPFGVVDSLLCHRVDRVGRRSWWRNQARFDYKEDD